MAIQAINARNQFKGQVKEIIRGDVLSEVDVQTPWGVVTSVITNRSIDELQLEPGSDVVALVKSTEVSIAKLLARVPPTTRASMESSRRPDRPVAGQLAMKVTRISSTLADAASGRLAAALHNPAPMPLSSNPARPAFLSLARHRAHLRAQPIHDLPADRGRSISTARSSRWPRVGLAERSIATVDR